MTQYIRPGGKVDDDARAPQADGLIQTPTEAVLVSGVNTALGLTVFVNLTAARLVGAPLNPARGQLLTFILVQTGAGAFAVTWNAVFKGFVWSNAGNATGTMSSITFEYDGASWRVVGTQSAWAA